MASRWSLNHSKPIPESALNFLSIMTYTYRLYLIFEFVLYMLHLLWMCNICCTFVLFDTYYTRFVPATFFTSLLYLLCLWYTCKLLICNICCAYDTFDTFVTCMLYLLRFCYRHPTCRPEHHLIGVYYASTQEILLTPIDMFPEGGFTNKINEEYNKYVSQPIG